MTYRELVTLALRELAVLATTQQPSDKDVEWGVDVLVGWLDSMSLGSLFQSERVYQEHEFTGTGEHRFSTIDLGFQFPAEFEIVSYRSASANDYRVLSRASAEQVIAQFRETSVVPVQYYVEQGEPGYLAFDAIPQGGETVRVIGKGFLTPTAAEAKASVSGMVGGLESGLPRGYDNMIRLSLARELAPSFGVVFTRSQEKAAMRAEEQVRKRNADPLNIRLDPGIVNQRGGYLRGGSTTSRL